jgi:hypothetical protein
MVNKVLFIYPCILIEQAKAGKSTFAASTKIAAILV